jgi:hypothetical protein
VHSGSQHIGPLLEQSHHQHGAGCDMMKENAVKVCHAAALGRS